jgi:hypothetical protein
MTNDTSTDNLYAFLRDEGLTYRGTLLEVADMIVRYLRDGDSDSMARASELTKSLQRLIDLDAD